jgi:N-acyl-D-amino-acid deacylase
MPRLMLALLALALAACSTSPVADAPSQRYDLLVRNGIVYDGSGGPPQRVDVAVRGDRIAALLPPGSAPSAARVVDARGRTALAVAGRNFPSMLTIL